MKEKKHIDRLFQEKFKDFEATPNSDLWSGIEDRLRPKKKKRRIAPIWWTASGVAAALLLFFALGGTGLFNQNVSEELPIVDVETPNDAGKTDEKSLDSDSSSDSRLTENDDESPTNNEDNHESSLENEESKMILKGNGTNAVVAGAPEDAKLNANETSLKQSASEDTKVASNSVNNPSKNKETESDILSKSKVKEILKSSESNSNTKVAEKDSKDTENSKETLKSEILENKTSIEDAIAEANELNGKEKENPNRWSIAPNVAPVYFASLSRGSAIDQEFINNNNKSNITMSYGIAGAYNVNPRLKIKAGVNRVEFDYMTEDALSMPNSEFVTRVEVSNIDNISLRSSEADIVVLNSASLVASSVPQALTSEPYGELGQRFGFIEVPVSLEYRLVDKKIGVNLSGGFSTFFLNSNEIYTEMNGDRVLIGSANNLNDTSFSANFGVGLDYGLSKKINVNLEPMFKYQINTFSNTSGDFRPFFIGVYTGLSFKF